MFPRFSPPICDATEPPLPSRPLSKDDQRALLEIARRALVETIFHQRVWKPEITEGQLAEPRGAFVTLEQRGRLRGCVGQPAAQSSIAKTVAHCAVAAALEDDRFDRVQPSELDEIVIEISVLSRMEMMQADRIEIGRHGLLIVCDDFRGLLLPQVASERRWSKERFLDEACRKAGLSADAWKLPGTQIYGFTSEVFSETEFAPRASSPAMNPAS